MLESQGGRGAEPEWCKGWCLMGGRVCGRRRCGVWLELVLLGKWQVAGVPMRGGHRYRDYLPGGW